MDTGKIRHCGPGDYVQVVDIYNHYIATSHATFDESAYTVGARAPWFAQFSETGPYQLLVARRNHQVAGFCCSTRFKNRSAYDVSVETSAYIAPNYLGQGIGRGLYKKLFERLENGALHGAYAGIALPNDASIRLHESLGFRKVGVYSEVGRKFDRFWDVAWYEKRLNLS